MIEAAERLLLLVYDNGNWTRLGKSVHQAQPAVDIMAILLIWWRKDPLKFNQDLTQHRWTYSAVRNKHENNKRQMRWQEKEGAPGTF